MSLLDSIKNTWAIVAIVGSAGSTIVGGAVWVMSFAKTADVSKAFEKVNQKIDAQNDKVDRVHTRLDVHEALLNHIDQELNQLLQRTLRGNRR